jgi:hypothetical protein
MKRLSYAAEDFIAAQTALFNDVRRSGSRSPPRHHQHVRRQRSRIDLAVPWLATHYPPAVDFSMQGSLPVSSVLGLLAENPHSVPVTILPTTTVLIVNTGASITITPAISDFKHPPTPVQPMVLQGIAAGLRVEGIGEATYTFQAIHGTPVAVTLPNVLYVPGCSTRLLCPHHLATSTGVDGDGFLSLIYSAMLWCYGMDIPVTYHEATALPLVISTASPLPQHVRSTIKSASPPAYARNASITTPSVAVAPPAHPINLSKSQQLKLLMHERCNHRSTETINTWIRRGLLPVDPSVANCPDPICAACQYGKAKQRSHKSFTRSIAMSATYPGAGVSSDQLEAGCPGRIPTSKGLPTNQRYMYVNLWVDHYSKYTYPTFHSSKHASELVKSKAEFETFASRYNVRIRCIRADNCVYSSQPFQILCDKGRQELTFCAVGGHWQNGVTEHHIGAVTQTARTLLLHAISHWPGVLSEEFWPFAIRHACNCHYSSINPTTHWSPHHMFTGNPAP